MQAQTKIVLYLQRQSNSNAGNVSAMQSVAGFLFALGVAYTPEASKPLGRSIMGLPSAFEWIDTGKWPPLFLCHIVKNSNKMKNTKKTAGETANPITFMAEWIDFTGHLTNAQFGRLARCVARFERGDINVNHVAELRKDAAVGVAYNFITDQISRRARP